MGQLVDRRYRIEDKLAVGGFGAIYRATDTTIGRQVALKILHRELAGDPNVVARFRRETAALAKLRSPNTLTLYDVGETDDTLYFVMELLRGESLFDLFERTGPLPWRRMARIARGVCSSLREAHTLGIVHRDLKPANIFLEHHALDADLVKVLDFGIAKILASSDLPNDDLTRHGQMIGTFDYMAPEQMVGGACTSKSDVFTLGVVIYEMLTGVRPYGDAVGPAQMLMALMTHTPTPLTGIPSELSRVVMKCLAREPHARPDVEALDAALAQVLEIDEATFGDADETTLIVAQAPRPSRPLSPPPGSTIPAPLRAPSPRTTRPRGSVAPLHIGVEDARVTTLPSVLIARDALVPNAPVARAPQGTPIAGTQNAREMVASPYAQTMMASGGQAAQAIAAAQDRGAQGLAPTLDLRPSTLPTLMARGSDVALSPDPARSCEAPFHARGSDVAIAPRDSHADIGVRCSERAIARDIELALAATMSSETSAEPFHARDSELRTPTVTRVPRDQELAVRFAPRAPVPTPKSRLAAGTSPIENDTQDGVVLAQRAVVLPQAPESSTLAAMRLATIAVCLFGLGFLGALAIWSL